MKFLESKVIYGCEGRGDAQSPYLTRYTLIHTENHGNLYLHVFHRSDGDVLHDHPWDFVSLVLWRGYIEETPYQLTANQKFLATKYAEKYGVNPWRNFTDRRRKWPGMILLRPATHIHRVELIGGKPAVTLVWVSGKKRSWGFHLPTGWKHWREYFKEMGC